VKRDIAMWWRRRCRTRILAAWAAHTALQLQQEQRRRKAVRHHYRTTLAAGLAGLQAAVRQGCQKRAAAERADVAYRERLLRRAFRGWVMLPDPDAVRATRVAAVTHHRVHVLRGAWAVWQHQTVRCASFRDLLGACVHALRFTPCKGRHLQRRYDMLQP
jgi:hypothetical protein